MTSHAKRIEMKLEAIKLAEMLEHYQRFAMTSDNMDLKAAKEKEFDDRRADFQIQYNTDFVNVLERVRAR